MTTTTGVASGCYTISGVWFTISGTSALTIVRALDASNCPKNHIFGITYNSDKTEFVVLGRM
jgi:hypothetical protein